MPSLLNETTQVFTSPRCIDDRRDAGMRLLGYFIMQLLVPYGRYIFVPLHRVKVSEIGRDARIYNTYFILVYSFLCNFPWLRVNVGGQSRRGEADARCDMTGGDWAVWPRVALYHQTETPARLLPCHRPPQGNIPPPVATGASQQMHKRKRGNFILVSGS